MAESQPPRDLPQVPDSVDPAIRRPLSRVIEEVQRLLEFRGDPLDAALTTRKAIARGLMDSLGRSLTGSVTYVNTFPGGGGGGGGTTPDLTPPPTVTGLTVVAGFTQVLVQFDAPVYSQGHGNLQTNIYASRKEPSDPTLPTFGDAVLVFSAPGALNVVSIPSELNTRWHVWAKYKTVDGVESVTAAGGTNGYNVAGAFPTTGQDIVQLLEVLTGSIRESQLYAALAEPIRSIVRRADDAAEDALRAALAVHAEAKRAVAALLDEARNRGTAITQTRTLLDTGDAQLASQITTLTAVVSSNLGTALAAVETEETARVDADDAEATLRETLASALIGAPDPTGLTLGTITSGMLYDERTTRSTQTGALAERAEVLEAAVTTPDTGLLARALALETVTTAAGSGNSALAERADALEATVDDPVAGVVATAGALETVKTLVNDGTNGVTALATRTSTLEARVESPSATPGDPDYNPTYAALQTEQSVRAALDGSVQALYTVRAEVSSGGRTVVGGFGLAGTATATAGPRIDFGVRADTFYVEAPSGGSNPSSRLAPFIIRTSTVTENGVSIPAGVFMDAAYIVNLSAMWARFGTLIADSIAAGQISAANLTLGDGTVGGDLKSSGFVAGSGVTPGTGWRLTSAGTLHASSAIIYGVIYAGAGAIGGNTIDATGVQSPGYTAGSTGWRLDTTGLVRAFASAGARVLDMAATGTQPVLKIGSALELLANGDASFSGTLNGADGTFSGTLTADAINAVNTINIAGNAVTIPTSAYTGSDVSCAADTDTTIQTVTWTSTGRPTFVSVSVNVEWPGTNVLCQFSLRTGAGVTIWSGYFSSYSRTGAAIVSFSTTWEAPPAGSVTLNLRARPSLMLTTSEQNLFTLEVKK